MTTYEELGKVIANESVIPADCLSFAEQAMYVAEYAQEEYNNLFEAVGVEELAVYESTGMEIVYEGAKLDSFKKRVEEFFKKIWAAIKAAFEKIYAFFISKSKKIMGEIGKIDAATVKKATEDKKDKVYGTFHDISGVNIDSKVNECVNMVKRVNDEFDSVDDKVFEKKDLGEAKEEINKIKENLIKLAFTKMVDKAESLSDISAGIKKEAKEVKVDGAWLSSNFSKLVEIVNGGKPINKLKETYKKEKATIDEAIKAAKGLKEKDMISAAQRIAVLGKLANAMDVTVNAYFDLVKKQFTESIVILVKVRSDANRADKKAKAEKKEKVGESVVYNADTVSSAFDW